MAAICVRHSACHITFPGILLATAVFGSMICPGCSPADERPETVRVTGSVTYNGEPVTSGEVRFSPVDTESGRVAVARIDSDGSFAASTFESGDGVMPGEYRITVASWVIDENTPQRDRDLGIGSEPAIPQKYFSVENSGLRETITEPRSLALKLAD